MRKLILSPDARGLSLKRAPAGEGASNLGAPSTAFGQRQPLQASVVEVTWSVLDAWSFNYFAAFWRTATARGAKPFLIDLPIQGIALEECTAKFVGQPPRITRVQGQTVSLKATLEAMPVTTIQANDATLALITEET